MYSCGGTILDASTILSAAHCFPKSDSPSTIRAGSLNRWSGGQVLIYFFFIKISLFFRNKRKSYIPLLITILLKCKKIMIFYHQARTVVQNIWNDNLVYKDGNDQNNDWVILKLDFPLNFNENVQPACLPPSNWSPDTDPNARCFVSGRYLISRVFF